jgi:hypothetical protein
MLRLSMFMVERCPKDGSSGLLEQIMTCSISASRLLLTWR